jgi:argininosuccinate synthase
MLEDPWQAPPEEIYAWTRSVKDAPDAPREIEIGFAHGRPVTLDGHEMDGVTLVQTLNQWAGEHGVGRTDLVEDRLIGIKSREIYEAPAAWTLHAAHEALEQLTLSKPQLRTKNSLRQEYADLIYNGLWFTAHHQDLRPRRRAAARVRRLRMRLHKGQAVAIGKKSPKSLYSYALATYDRGDQYDQGSAVGFIKIWGLPVSQQARAQLLAEGEAPFQLGRRSRAFRTARCRSKRAGPASRPPSCGLDRVWRAAARSRRRRDRDGAGRIARVSIDAPYSATPSGGDPLAR